MDLRVAWEKEEGCWVRNVQPGQSPRQWRPTEKEIPQLGQIEAGIYRLSKAYLMWGYVDC